jgi:glycosyltransferase involved in cell wall biosynthesis
MNIVLFTHPAFFKTQSMPRFARMLAAGMRERGHQVDILTPQPLFYSLPVPRITQKWLGYADQYLVFPIQVRRKLPQYPANTLFVFTDQALGPWVPLVAKRPHVIHCHDFLAQRSALGEVPENATGWTGRHYQTFIRQGYSKGQHFISVSQCTREDLHRFLPTRPANSEVVYNGLNQKFILQDTIEARCVLGHKIGLDLTAGYLLHVGGNQWYKNRIGVIELYNAWRNLANIKIPLLLIGETPCEALSKAQILSAYATDIHIISSLGDESVRLAYMGATVFLFPSLAEGFGWPIAEAMAAGCPVITTQEAPMTEVGSDVAFYIPRRPVTEAAGNWAATGAQVIQRVVDLDPSERKAVIEAGVANASRFDSTVALDRIEAIYQNILQTYQNG